MKKIRHVLAVITLLTISAFNGYAQNAIKHIDNAKNVNLDYKIPTDEYVLSGNTYPPTIGGMRNVGPVAGNLSRIQLEILDNQLNSLMFKTYCNLQEVNDVMTGQCTHLAAYYTTGDAKHTADGGYIICGAVRVDGETSGCPGATAYDHLFMLKVDVNGVPQWYKRYYDPNMQFGMLNSVVEASNGNFIACGYENYGSYTGALILGVDPAGNLLWSNYEQTPAHWDYTTVIPSVYYEITPYTTTSGNSYYVLVGISNTFGSVWGGTLLTVIDANGNYIADNIIDNENWGYTLVGRGIHDAYDNDVVVTGAAGTPCQSGSQVMVLKINPITLTQTFFKVYSYNNTGDVSLGNSIVTWGSAGGNFSVTGRDYSNNNGLYMELDNNGNLLRYTPFNDGDAALGKSIVWNSTSSFPAYSGEFWPATEPTFIIRNNYGTDCPTDITMPNYDTPTEYYPPSNIPAPIVQIDDDALVYDINPIESIVCGQLKQGTSVKNTTALKTLTITPNPANDRINLNLQDMTFSSGNIKIYDMTGRIVLTQQYSNSKSALSVDIANLPKGTYALNVNDANGTNAHTTFVKD